MTTSAPTKAVFRVIDAYDHPHGGRILRLRLAKGEAPSLRELRGAAMVATTMQGEETRVELAGFALFGGRPTDARMARTGRVDIHVTGREVQAVGPGWSLAGPV